MMKHWLSLFFVLSLLSLLVVACARDGSESGGTSSTPIKSVASTPTEVHTSGASFAQSSITISKGGMLKLVDDDANVHIIANGSWANGVSKPARESGGPIVKNLQLTSKDSVQIGPFNTAGTYHLYCIVHPNMNLTVKVR